MDVNKLAVGDTVRVGVYCKIVGFVVRHGRVLRVLVEMPKISDGQVVMVQAEMGACLTLGDSGVTTGSR